MKVYIVTIQPGRPLYYTSITAVLLDPGNPIDISNRRWSQIVKERGYPFTHSGCVVDVVQAQTLRDVRENNPPMEHRSAIEAIKAFGEAAAKVAGVLKK